MATPELLKVPEAAARLRVSRSTIYERIAAGELRAWKLGNAPNAPLRIPALDVEHLLREHQPQPAEPDFEAELDGLREQLRKAAP